MSTTAAKPRSKEARKAFWTKQFYLWHWVSSALSLAGMLFFAVTGITLNHAGQIGATPKVEEKREMLPPEMLKLVQSASTKEKRQPLPPELAQWVKDTLSISVAGRPAQWSAEEVHVDLPRPGGDSWLNIDRESGEVTYEVTSRGFISFLNDLHKGRHTGVAWSWFIDIFSVAAIVFCLTGLVLLYVHARRRPSTWPVVLAGIALPVLLIVLFIH